MEMGGWLYDCGHFHQSTFMQIAKVEGDCYTCRDAKAVLEQSEKLKRSGKSAPPKYETTFNRDIEHIPEKKRTPDCTMKHRR